MTETLHDIYARHIADGHLSEDPAQVAVLDPLQAIRDALENTPQKRGLSKLFSKSEAGPKGLYIWGGVGRGKSMLMDMFFNAVDIPQKRRVHFHAFMQNIQTALHEARKTGVEDAIEPVAQEVIRDTRLLCFDEMQITDITDAMIVGRLFEKFFAAGMVIVATSNRVPDDLYKDGLNRDLFLPFIDQIKEKLTVWELVSPKDYRQDRLAGDPVYFTPVDALARQAMSDIWLRMTGGEGDELRLMVKGHEVVLPAFRNGVARATFWDLCSKPLGPGDFLAIARAVKVLLLEEVPLLSSENYNEAKRFVTLIDALYESHIRLIMSAADVPERLYLEGTGSFEFERTASRLREMQSEDWSKDWQPH